MVQEIVRKHDLQNFSSIKEDLSHWLMKTLEEQVAPVEYLWNQQQ